MSARRRWRSASSPGVPPRRPRAARARRRRAPRLVRPQREPRWGNGKRGDEPDENEPRGAPGGGPRRRRRGARHVRAGAWAPPSRRTGPARVRGAPRCSRSKSRFCGAPTTRGRTTPPAGSRWASCSPPSPPTRARAPGRRSARVRFRDPRGSPAARHVASHRVRLGRARARGAHTAPRARRRRRPDPVPAPTRRRRRRRRGRRGRRPPRRRLRSPREPPATPWRCARAARPRAVPQMYHQTRAKKRPSRECCDLRVACLASAGALLHVALSAGVAVPRAEAAAAVAAAAPASGGVRVRGGLRLRGGGGRGDACRGRRARRRAGRLVVPGGRGGRGGRPERGPRRRPRERERGAAARRNRAGKRRTHSHNLCCGATPLAPRRRAPRRPAAGAGGGGVRGGHRRRGRGSVALRARETAAWGLALAADAAVARAGAAVLDAARGPASARGSRLGERLGLGETKPNERLRRRRAPTPCSRDTRTRRAAGPQRKRPLSRRRARCACSRRSNVCPRATRGTARPAAGARRIRARNRGRRRRFGNRRRAPRRVRRALARASRGPGGGRRVPSKPHSGRYPPTSPAARAPCSSGWARASPRSPRARGGGAPPRRRRRRAGAGRSTPETEAAFSAASGDKLQTKYTRADAARTDDARRLRRALDALRATWRGLLRAVDPNASLAARLPVETRVRLRRRRRFPRRRRGARLRRRKFLRLRRKQNVFTVENKTRDQNAVREEDLPAGPWSFGSVTARGGVARGGSASRGGRGDGPRRGRGEARASTPASLFCDARRRGISPETTPRPRRGGGSSARVWSRTARSSRRTRRLCRRGRLTKAASTGSARWRTFAESTKTRSRRGGACSSPRALVLDAAADGARRSRRRRTLRGRSGDTSRARKRRTPDPTARASPRPPSRPWSAWTRRATARSAAGGGVGRLRDAHDRRACRGSPRRLQAPIRAFGTG